MLICERTNGAKFYLKGSKSLIDVEVQEHETVNFNFMYFMYNATVLP